MRICRNTCINTHEKRTPSDKSETINNMNTVERLTAVFKGEPVDRVPVTGWLGWKLLKRLTGKNVRTMMTEWVENPVGSIVKIQEDLGFDPIILTVCDCWTSTHRFWRLLYSWPPEALANWQVKEEIVEHKQGSTTHHFTASTPQGDLAWGYTVADAGVCPGERPLKEEKDLELLQYLPEPESLNQDKLTAMVKKVGNRAFFTHNFIGVWGEAVNWRGLATLSTDLYDRPEWVKRLMEILMERAIRRVRHLGKTGIHSIVYDETWVGMGLSPQIYEEFILPYDKQVVKAARDAGILVSYHILWVRLPLPGADGLHGRGRVGDTDSREQFGRFRFGRRQTACW